MLQQTRASVVTAYFERWMKALPRLEDLAAAREGTVIKLWEGLGYYSRARNLMRAAQEMLTRFGEVPRGVAELESLPGIGPYTARAIAAFAFHQRTAAVDGNVARFVSRLGAIDRGIQEYADSLLPEEKPWIVAEAMIEMGATICGKKPLCGQCPVQAHCRAYAEDRVEEFPPLAKRSATIVLEKRVAVCRHGDHWLVKNPPQKGLMAGLHEFPEKIRLRRKGKELAVQTHSYTKYRVTLRPYLVEVDQRFEQEECSWKSREEIAALAFSAGHKRIWESLC